MKLPYFKDFLHQMRPKLHPNKSPEKGQAVVANLQALFGLVDKWHNTM
jgi:hypothetical protein